MNSHQNTLTIESILNKEHPKDFYVFQEENMINGLDIPEASNICRKVSEFVLKPALVGQTIKCIINFTSGIICSYTLNLENEDGHMIPLLVSRKSKYSLMPSFAINGFEIGLKSHEEVSVALLEKNIFSSIFSLYENKITIEKTDEFEYSNNHKQINETRKTLMYVEYDSFISNIGMPIKMTVYLPGVDEKRNSNFEFFYNQEEVLINLNKNKTNSQISSITEFNNQQSMNFDQFISVEDNNENAKNKQYLNKSGNINLFYGPVVKLITKSPTFDKLTNVFKLDMNNRAKMKSIANFQLIHESNPNYVVMQCGKLDKDVFTCDYSYPMNALQAFCVALSCLYKNE